MVDRNSITIYPDDDLMKKLEKEAEKQKRSKNNLVLFILASFFSKKQWRKDLLTLIQKKFLRRKNKMKIKTSYEKYLEEQKRQEAIIRSWNGKLLKKDISQTSEEKQDEW